MDPVLPSLPVGPLHVSLGGGRGGVFLLIALPRREAAEGENPRTVLLRDAPPEKQRLTEPPGDASALLLHERTGERNGLQGAGKRPALDRAGHEEPAIERPGCRAAAAASSGGELERKSREGRGAPEPAGVRPTSGVVEGERGGRVGGDRGAGDGLEGGLPASVAASRGD